MSKMIRNISRFTAILFLFSMFAAGLTSGQQAITTVPVTYATSTVTPPHDEIADALPVQRKSAPPNGELQLVVALFRHGIRAPLKDFGETEADKHSKDKWPALTDWKVMGTDCDPGKGWGYLTTHGQKLAQGLGTYYGKHYKQGAWSNGFNIYLWADAENQRTRESAKALAQGFVAAGIPAQDVTTDSLGACTVDLLFHPFKAGCGAAQVSTGCN